MITDFQAILPFVSRVVNLRTYPFSGGCLGCFGCAITGKCVYKDGFDDFLRTKIQTADAIVYAFTITDHYTQSSFKCYDDRQFCNGHRTVTQGIPVAYLISGDYQYEANLRTIVEANRYTYSYVVLLPTKGIPLEISRLYQITLCLLWKNGFSVQLTSTA